MSDPRLTDPRYNDPRSPPDDMDAPRRFDRDPRIDSGAMWTGVAVIIAIIVVLGLAVGYNRTDEASNQRNTPTTTGAAPAVPRPAAPAAPANPGGNASQQIPATPTSPAPATQPAR
jgi:hypothetical protein